MAMPEGLVVHLWKESGISVLVVVSFLLQLVLVGFAWIRRRSSSATLMALLWLAYLTADTVAIYALGHMSLDSRPHEEGLVAFWATFFLLHLGGQDTITAFSLEDNQLWRRHLLTLLVQTLGVSYALYRYILPGSWTLISATILMFIVGFIKYGERVWALKSADIETLSPFDLRNHQIMPGKLNKRCQMDVEEELLLDSHYMLEFCKSSFLNVGREVRFRAMRGGGSDINQSRLFNRDMYMYDLVEAELSLMYDLLYTKAQVVHSWRGYWIRVVSPLATVAAFLLFQLGGKSAYSRVDVAITYLLLVGAITLEIASVFRVLGSTWTCAYLDSQELYRTNATVMRLRWLVGAGSKRRWSQSIGQHNVLDYCSREQYELRGTIAKAIGLEDWWKKVHFSSNIPITTEFKVLVVARIKKAMGDSETWSIMDARGRAVLTDHGMLDDIGWSVEGRDLAELIFIWHVATDIYLRCCNNHQARRFRTEDEELLAKAIMILSNYMGFLLLVRPNLLPGGVQYYLLEKNYMYMEHDVRVNHGFTGGLEDRTTTADGNHTTVHSTSQRLARFLLDTFGENQGDLHATYHQSVRLASKLLGNEWNLPNMMEVIFAVWVEFLCYAALHSTDVSHCKQLGRGGDFLTVIRLVVDHNELFQQAQDHEAQGSEMF